jgi:hypothetical protein
MILSSHGIIGSSIGQVDADYQAVLDYATTQGYTLPSASQRLLQEQLVIDLKDAGIWSKLDTFGVFATDGDSDFALIDWIRLSDYTAVNSPTFNVNEGFEGNGTSSYIDLNYTTDTDWNNVSQDDACLFAYAFADVYPSNGGIFGGDQLYIQLNPRSSLGTVVTRIHNTSGGSTSTLNGEGLTIANRSSASSYDVYQRGSFVQTVSQSTSLLTSEIYAMRISDIYFPSKPSILGYSSSLTSTQITDLTNYLDTYITSL